MLDMRTEPVGGADLGVALDEWGVVHAADLVAAPFSSSGWARAPIRHGARRSRPWGLLVRPGDYWDIFGATADRTAVAEELLRSRHACHAAILSCLPPGSSRTEVLAEAGLRLTARRDVGCPSTTLPAAWYEYLAMLTHRPRGNCAGTSRGSTGARWSCARSATALSCPTCSSAGPGIGKIAILAGAPTLDPLTRAGAERMHALRVSGDGVPLRIARLLRAGT